MIWSTPGIVVGEDPALEASDDAIEATAGFGAIVKAMIFRFDIASDM